jgi:molecular chaperone GrpE (heat shock protein)
MSEQNKIDEIKSELDQVNEELFYEKRASEESHVKFVEQYELLALLQKEVEHLLKEVERKDEALRFYADKENYRGFYTAGGYWKAPANDDDGNRAREAL